MIKQITFESYLEECRNFAELSKTWSALHDNKFYTTGKWSPLPNECFESCDNAHGGIDISWAFHKTKKQIRENALKMYHAELWHTINVLYENAE